MIGGELNPPVKTVGDHAQCEPCIIAPAGHCSRCGGQARPALPKIFVFCNGCSPGWHNFVALAEDGAGLAGHVCSDHGYARHDMGIDEDRWKRDLYAAHYPDGFEVVYVEVRGKADFQAHPGLVAAGVKNSARGRVIVAYRELHGSDPTEEFIRDAAASLLAQEAAVTP